MCEALIDKTSVGHVWSELLLISDLYHDKYD